MNQRHQDAGAAQCSLAFSGPKTGLKVLVNICNGIPSIFYPIVGSEVPAESNSVQYCTLFNIEGTTST